MIKLSATINLINAQEQTLSGVSSNLLGNNISGQIGAVMGVKKRVNTPFIIGQSIINGANTLSSGESYFIGKQLTDNNKLFANQYTITLSGSDITNFTIIFDDKNNIFPTSIQINGITYANDDAYFTIANLSKSNTFVVTITNLNVPNSVLVISSIFVGLSIDINNRNLISLTRKITDRADKKLPSWGIISNSGNIEFNDFNGEVKDYAEMLLLKSGINVIITLEDTISGKSQQIGKFIADTWNYDNDSKKVSLSLQDELLEWQDILVEAYPLQSQMTMAQIYNYLYNLTPAKYNMSAYNNLDSETQAILTNTVCQYPYLEKGNLWNEWQKLCEICALHIYKKNDGTTTCTYDFRS